MPGAISKYTGQLQFLSRYFHPALPGELLPPVSEEPVPVSECGVLAPGSSASALAEKSGPCVRNLEGPLEAWMS